MKKLIILILLAGVVTLLSNENEYIPIPSSSIRMRVIANSNSKKDQDDKKIIKSILEEKLYEVIKDADNPRDIDSVLVENKNSIDAAINSEMVKEESIWNFLLISV